MFSLAGGLAAKVVLEDSQEKAKNMGTSFIPNSYFPPKLYLENKKWGSVQIDFSVRTNRVSHYNNLVYIRNLLQFFDEFVNFPFGGRGYRKV